jgi:hypothetical protein
MAAQLAKEKLMEVRLPVCQLEDYYRLKIADSAIEFAARFEGLYPWPGTQNILDALLELLQWFDWTWMGTNIGSFRS